MHVLEAQCLLNLRHSVYLGQLWIFHVLQLLTIVKSCLVLGL